MLSEESAMGKYPVEAVQMLARTAAATEPYRSDPSVRDTFASYNLAGDLHFLDLLSRSIQQTVARLEPTAVIVPTVTGHTARMVSRFKLPVWIAAVSPQETTCRGLQFSFGVSPVHLPEYPQDWNRFARCWVENEELPRQLILFTEGPSKANPKKNLRLEIIDLRDGGNGAV